MTLYFIFSGTHPPAGTAQSSRWADTVRRALRATRCKTWTSAPNRLARLILRATNTEQSQRLDMGQMYSDICLMRDAVVDPGDVQSAELWAEELFERAFGDDYEWDVDRLHGQVHTASGWTVTIRGREVDGVVALDSSWADTGERDRRAVGKLVPRAAEHADAALKKGGWKVKGRTSGGQSLGFSAEIRVSEILQPGVAARAAKAIAEHAQVMGRAG